MHTGRVVLAYRVRHGLSQHNTASRGRPQHKPRESEREGSRGHVWGKKRHKKHCSWRNWFHILARLPSGKQRIQLFPQVPVGAGQHRDWHKHTHILKPKTCIMYGIYFREMSHKRHLLRQALLLLLIVYLTDCTYLARNSSHTICALSMNGT